MAFGISPKHIRNLPLDNFTQEEFLVISLEVAKKLDWKIGSTGEDGFLAYTAFSLASWSEEIELKITQNGARLKSKTTGNQLVDWGKNKRNIESFVSSFNEMKNSFTQEQLAEKIAVLQSILTSQEQNVFRNPVTTKGKIRGVLAVFKPAKGFIITPVLIDLNIVVFILMISTGVSIFMPENESLINWGANFRPVTLDGQWWRLITCCFLHIGIFHLLMNMYALLYIGLLLEPLLGWLKFATAYILAGIISSVTSLYWHELTISAGASGAIFGMYGVFLAMLSTNLVEKTPRKALLTSIVVFVGYNLLNGMKGGIDNAAHIGGLTGGLIIGFLYYPAIKKPGVPQIKYGTIAMLIVLVCSTSFVIYEKIPNNFGKYEESMKHFSSMESMALEFYKLPEEMPKEELLYEIKNRGIYYWKENIKLLRETDKLNLPSQLHERNRKLIHYCELRIKSYKFIYKFVNENSHWYHDSILFYNKEIETFLDSLK